jgi:hypothetical protein
MQYLALIYAAPEAAPLRGTPEHEAMMAGYGALTTALKADGAYLAGEGLKPVETATSVRLRAGRVETMDGPFADTKEHLAGFYLIDVPDLDSALKYAARIPTAAYGTIEVRPVMVY